MKIKWKKYCGLLLLTVLLMSACKKQGADVNEDVPGNEIESETELETESQKEELTDGEDAIQSEEKVQKSAILNQAQNVDAQGILKYIPNTRVEQGLQQKIQLFQGNLLVWGTALHTDNTPGLGLAVLSLETGEVLREVSLAGFDIPDVQVCDDVIAVTDWADGKVRLLDETLAIVKEYQADAEYCTVYVSPDATKVYCFTQEKGVRITNMETGNTEVLLENATMLFGSNRCGNSVSVSYTDKNTQLSVNGIIDLSKGTAAEIPFTGAFYNVDCSEEIWMAGVLGEDDTYYLGKSERPNSFKPYSPNSMMTLVNKPTRLLENTYDAKGASTLTLYEVNGRFLSQCILSIEGASLYDDPVWSENDDGYFFTVTDASGKDMLLFWDISVPVSGMDLQLESEYQGSAEIGSAVSQELYSRAAAITDKYGVEIKIAEQVDTVHSEYEIQPEMDESYILSALNAVETVLAAYPDGFIEQLVYGDQIKVEMQLAGSLTKTDIPKDASGFTSYSGFASQEEGKNLIVIDITFPGFLEQTIYHEIAHLIDYKLEFDAGIRDDAFYSEEGWMALNPEGFAYADTKVNLPDSFYNDGFDSWFIDLYSRTSIKEDRARIMEYAIVGADWAFSSAPKRAAKLEYWCNCIRDAFDTTGWPDKTIWEMTLEECI